MRLDKFLGKAAGSLKVTVKDYHSVETCFCMIDWCDYSTLKEEMKNYKVVYYDTDHDGLLVLVKKKGGLK